MHPSDMCVALVVLEAKVHVTGPRGDRVIAMADFHRLPGDEPQRDNTLAADELVTGIELPPRGFAEHHTYLKIRDRLSYAFALVSVAVGLELEGGKITEARFALGGVAHKPWRNAAAEAALRGQPAEEASFARAADLVLARPRASAITTSRSTWRAGPSSAPSPRRPAARPSPSPTRRSREDRHGTLHRHRHIASRRRRQSHRRREIRRRVHRPRACSMAAWSPRPSPRAASSAIDSAAALQVAGRGRRADP